MPPFLRQLFLYEAPEDGGGSVEEPVESVATEPEAPEPEAWALDREEWERTQQFLQQAAPILGYVAEQLQREQYEQPVPQGQYPAVAEDAAPPEIDPFDPNSVQRYVEWATERKVQEALQSSVGPYQDVMQHIAVREGEQAARETLTRLSSEVGAFDEDAALILAAGMIEQGQQPEQALRVSASYLNELETKIRADERERYKKELQEIAGAPQETTVAGGPVTTELETVPTGRGRYEEAMRRAMARRGANTVV